MPNGCLEIPRKKKTSRFCLDNGLLIDVAGNATRRGTLYQGQTFDATRGRPQHWLVMPLADLRRFFAVGRRTNFVDSESIVQLRQGRQQQTPKLPVRGEFRLATAPRE